MNKIEKLAGELATAQNELMIADEVIAKKVADEIVRRDMWADKERELRAALLSAFEDPEINTQALSSVENEYIKVSYRHATTRKGVDGGLLRREYPDIYEEVKTETPVKASVIIKVKDENRAVVD